VPVPPGPGVRPPFAAAPTEGRTARRWLSVGLAAAALVVFCGIGGVAVGGLVVTLAPAMNEQAQAAVGDYLDALVAEDWEQAHESRCEQDREAEPLSEFIRRVEQEPRIEAYELGSIDWFVADADRLELPAELTYDDGSSEQTTYPLVADPRTGTLQVCQHA
jgi:hypothetical protein